MYQIPYSIPVDPFMQVKSQETIIKKLQVSEPNSAHLPTTYTHSQVPHISSFSPGNIKMESKYLSGSVQPLSFEDRLTSQVFSNISIPPASSKGIVYSHDIPEIKHILESHKKESHFSKSETEKKLPNILNQQKNNTTPLSNKAPLFLSPPSTLLNPIP